MPWSNKSLVKGAEVGKSNSSKSIVTKLPTLPVKKVATSTQENQLKQKTVVKEPEQAQSLTKEQKQAQKLEAMKTTVLQQAQEEAAKIIETAREQATIIQAQAQEEAQTVKTIAQQQGLEEGQQSGYQVGYQEGITQAKVESEELLKQATASLQEAMASAETYVKEKQQELIQFSIEMAEALIQAQFDFDEKTILAIVNPILLKLEKADQLITVRANGRYHELLQRRMEQLKQEIPSLRYVVLNDASMGAYELSVESDETLAIFHLEDELRKFLQQISKD
ncbi:hypothetical protein IV487_10460 [Enterococcus saccharolyticus]|uniref:Flagellar assembly protein FliH/Type III secretion system HrpE domain-containing protein n=1 Tax=Candidatus Enterococcus willemsii TaxID=1857215 RepID=A0ABQ6YX12_9ENTE|nr:MULTISPECIES: FliH/SctL family protein [Enterococcus]KAF1302009.1 hypothetical protein BAU17_01170 [Enterococcus sp. CU12B]MCD5002884.1 hypothetical protein [Enterococcus saccharolyticus]